MSTCTNAVRMIGAFTISAVGCGFYSLLVDPSCWSVHNNVCMLFCGNTGSVLCRWTVEYPCRYANDLVSVLALGRTDHRT